MTLQLFLNKSEKSKMSKELTNVAVLDGTFREETNIINPSIIVENNGYITANYLFIPDLKRYYFITDIISVRKNLWRLNCHVDVLMSFKDEILANVGTVARQENRWNMYIDDGTFRSYANELVQFKAFPNKDVFNNDNIILITVGPLKL